MNFIQPKMDHCILTHGPSQGCLLRQTSSHTQPYIQHLTRILTCGNMDPHMW